MTHPAGPALPLGDIIAQWIAEVFSGERGLPAAEVMEANASQDVAYQARVTTLTELCIEEIAEAMGRRRPDTMDVLLSVSGLKGSERRTKMMEWLTAPRFRWWQRPEDIPPTAFGDALFESKL